MRILALLVMIGTAWAMIAPACAVEPLVPAEKHPWAKFPPGSWKRMRVTIETFDERGVATTTSEVIRTMIRSVDDEKYTLTAEKITEGFNTRVTHDTVVGLSGNTKAQEFEGAKTIGESELDVNGRKIPCLVREAVMTEGTTRTTIKIHYSPDVSPHILKRERTVTTAPNNTQVTTMEDIIALGFPFDVLGGQRTVSFVRTRQKSASQTKDTIEVTCDEVPGGIVSQWSKKLDAEGKLLERSTHELLEYQVAKPPGEGVPVNRSRMLDRKRARRADDRMSYSSRRDR